MSHTSSSPACPSEEGSLPEFGYPTPGTRYILRPGAYAVIFNAADEVAVIATPRGHHLPGGGQEAEESLPETAAREVREEAGLEILVKHYLGTADELVYAPTPGAYFRKRGSFYLAEMIQQRAGCEPDHELRWMSPAEALEVLVHGSHRWALSKAQNCEREHE